MDEHFSLQGRRVEKQHVTTLWGIWLEGCDTFKMAACTTGIRTLSIFLCVREACDIHERQIITNNTPFRRRTISAGKYTVSLRSSQTQRLLTGTSRAWKNVSAPSRRNTSDCTLKYEQIIENISTQTALTYSLDDDQYFRSKSRRFRRACEDYERFKDSTDWSWSNSAGHTFNSCQAWKPARKALSIVSACHRDVIKLSMLCVIILIYRLSTQRTNRPITGRVWWAIEWGRVLWTAADVSQGNGTIHLFRWLTSYGVNTIIVTSTLFVLYKTRSIHNWKPESFHWQ